MTTNQKLLLGLAGAGVLAYLLFKGSKAKAQTTQTTDTENGGKVCPEGQIPCANNSGCFDPNVTYIRNPCE